MRAKFYDQTWLKPGMTQEEYLRLEVQFMKFIKVFFFNKNLGLER